MSVQGALLEQVRGELAGLAADAVAALEERVATLEGSLEAAQERLAAAEERLREAAGQPATGTPKSRRTAPRSDPGEAAQK